MSESKDDLQTSVLSFSCVGPKTRTQVLGLGGRAVMRDSFRCARPVVNINKVEHTSSRARLPGFQSTSVTHKLCVNRDAVALFLLVSM